MKKEKHFFRKNLVSASVGFAGGVFGALLISVLFVVISLTTVEQKVQSLVEEKVITQENLIINAISKASPAVVSIIITKDIPIMEKYYRNSPFLGPFDDFFGGLFGDPRGLNFQVPQYRQKGTEKKEVGGGSGFFVSKNGMIITNKHVVDDKDAEYTVFTNDGEKYNASVMAVDPVNDVAVLKIEGENFSFLEFADSDELKVGQTTIAIGNALGEFENTVSVGIISGLSRSLTAGDNFGKSEQLEGIIQTDAAINPGNSGGPLLNSHGKVIGVNVAMASGSENIGFSLPSNMVKSVFESVKEYGKVVRPFLGVRYIIINEKIKEKNKLSVDYGALILRGENREDLAVIPGSPADKAGIEENDIILEVNGVKITQKNLLSQIIKNKSVGDKISLKILHKGDEKNIEVTLQEIPE
jgi:serine protease Do